VSSQARLSGCPGRWQLPPEKGVVFRDGGYMPVTNPAFTGLRQKSEYIDRQSKRSVASLSELP